MELDQSLGINARRITSPDRYTRRGFLKVSAAATLGSSEAYQYDWLVLSHGRYNSGSDMGGLKDRIMRFLPTLVNPDHIWTPDYPNSDDPNLEDWMRVS